MLVGRSLKQEETDLIKVADKITRWVWRLAAVAGTALALLASPLASFAQAADETR